MSDIFLRLLKRRKSRDLTDPVEFIHAEFTRSDGSVDLEPSCYKVAKTEDEVIRTTAEHTAGANLDPPRSFQGVSLPDVDSNSMRHEPLSRGFQFIGQRHHVLPIVDKKNLAVLAGRLLNPSPSHWVEIELGKVQEYVRARFRTNDSEWLQFANTSAKAAKWQSW